MPNHYFPKIFTLNKHNPKTLIFPHEKYNKESAKLDLKRAEAALKRQHRKTIVKNYHSTKEKLKHYIDS